MHGLMREGWREPVFYSTQYSTLPVGVRWGDPVGVTLVVRWLYVGDPVGDPVGAFS